MSSSSPKAVGGWTRRVHALAFAWGLAEAVIFFVVPDVLLTWVALHRLRTALLACAWALLGALIGGAGLWLAANNGHAAALLRVFETLPGIHLELIAETGQATAREGASCMFAGALTGRPYKLYAVHAGAHAVPFAVFMGVSALARAARFLLTTLAAWAVARVLPNRAKPYVALVHLLFWCAFYVVYFARMRS